MQERSRIKVDEGALQQMIAAGVPLRKAQEIPNEPEAQDMEEHELDVESAKTQKKKRNPKFGFAETFLKDNKIRDRRQIYISKEAYDKISRYLRYIGQGNVSLVSYVDNILFHHMDEYRETINDLYSKNFNTPL